MARLQAMAMNLIVFASYTLDPVLPQLFETELSTWTQLILDNQTNHTSTPSLRDATRFADAPFGDVIEIITTIKNNATTESVLNTATNTTVRGSKDMLSWVIRVVITSAIAVFGLIANSVSVIVLASPRMTSSNSVILIFMAFFDSLILLRHILFITIRSILSSSLSSDRLNDIYSIPVNVIFRPFEHIGHFGSVYTTILLTFERFVVVFFPLRVITLCTIKRTRISGIVILILSVVYNIPKFMVATLHTTQDPDTNLTKFIVIKSNFSNELTFFFGTVYTMYLEKIFMLALPAFAIVVLNSCILYKLWQNSRQFKTVSSAVFGRRASVTDRVTAMTLAIVFTFCVTLVIIQVHRYRCRVNIGQTRRGLPEQCYALNLASTLMYSFNSSINPVYYCLFGAKFRQALVLKFACLFKKTKYKTNSALYMYELSSK